MTLQCPSDRTAQLATLQAQLAALQAVRFSNTLRTEKYITLHLSEYALTHDNMCALQGLPQWAGVVVLTDCEWPLAPTEYRALAQHMPTAFMAWMLPGKPGSPLVESITQGIEQCKERLGPLPVVLLLPEYKGSPIRVGEHALLANKYAQGGLQLYGVEKLWNDSKSHSKSGSDSDSDGGSDSGSDSDSVE